MLTCQASFHSQKKIPDIRKTHIQHTHVVETITNSLTCLFEGLFGEIVSGNTKPPQRWSWLV